MSKKVLNMPKNNITYIVIFLSIFSAARADANPGTESYEDLVTKLNYGDRCSWKTEKLRQDYVESIVGMLDIGKINTTSEEFKLNVTKNGRVFCNAMALLICNKETKTCDCGDPKKAVLLGEQAGSKSYIVETTDDGQQRCRWAENEGCVPDVNVFPGTLNSLCQSGTSCLAVGKQHACSNLDTLLYAWNNKATDASKILKAISNGKICSCQSGGSTQSQGDNSDSPTDITNSRVRRFAGTWRPNPDISVYGGVIAPFVDSF